MRKLYVFDTTLRDGEQSLGITLNIREKLEIGRQLVTLGVDIIEAGFPASSPGDFESVQRISREIKGVTICGLTRALPQMPKVPGYTPALLFHPYTGSINWESPWIRVSRWPWMPSNMPENTFPM